MQTFNLTPLLNDKINILVSKIPELKRVSFQHGKNILKKNYKKYPFIMPNSLSIVIKVPGTIVRIMIVNVIGYFKYCKATGKVKEFSCMIHRENKTPPPATYQLQALNSGILTSHPPSKYLLQQLLRIKSIYEEILLPERKTLVVVHYSKQTDNAEIRSVTPENVQEWLEDMGLEFSKYSKFKV